MSAPRRSWRLCRMCWLCWLLCLACHAHAETGSAPRLRDPFERPRGVAAPVQGDAGDGARAAEGATFSNAAAGAGAGSPGDAGGRAPSAASAAPEFTPVLRAVVFDGARSLVNLGGRIVSIGESVAGYKLLGVEERSALFLKDGARTRLFLDKENTK